MGAACGAKCTGHSRVYILHVCVYVCARSATLRRNPISWRASTFALYISSEFCAISSFSRGPYFALGTSPLRRCFWVENRWGWEISGTVLTVATNIKIVRCGTVDVSLCVGIFIKRKIYREILLSLVVEFL